MDQAYKDMNKTYINAFNNEAEKFGKKFGKYAVITHLESESDPYPRGEVMDTKTGKIKTFAFKGKLDIKGKRSLWNPHISKNYRDAINYMKEIHRDMHTIAHGLYEEWYDKKLDNYKFYSFEPKQKK